MASSPLRFSNLPTDLLPKGLIVQILQIPDRPTVHSAVLATWQGMIHEHEPMPGIEGTRRLQLRVRFQIALPIMLSGKGQCGIQQSAAVTGSAVPPVYIQLLQLAYVRRPSDGSDADAPYNRTFFISNPVSDVITIRVELRKVG